MLFPEQWDDFSTIILSQRFGVAKLVVTIQVEHDASLLSSKT
jgi:hypothetical protein